MGINLGSSPVADLKMGETQVDKAYLGSELVWQKSQPGPTVRALKFTSPQTQTVSRYHDYPYLYLNFEYSNDGETWSTWNLSNPLSFGNGVDLYIRGSNSAFLTQNGRWQFEFSTSSPVYCSGSLMHLLDYTQDLATLPEGGAQNMFYNCTQLVTPPDLPATSLPANAYQYMFFGCTSLTSMPALPATEISVYAYSNMFSGCTSLTGANTISATIMPSGACERMFESCTSLVNAPALPATTLGGSAYYYMFNGCTSLETIPALPATTLASLCYSNMFNGCSKIKMSTTQSAEYPNEFVFGTNPSGYCNRMFRNTGGSFVGNPDQTTYYTANTIIS